MASQVISPRQELEQLRALKIARDSGSPRAELNVLRAISPKAAPQFQEPTVLGGLGAAAASVTEPAATLLTGAVLEPVAGLAGIAALPFGAETASNLVNDIRGMAFQPRTEAGQASIQSLGESAPIQALQASEHALGNELEGSGIFPPGVGGAIGSTIPVTILTLAGAGPARTLSRTPKRLTQDAPRVQDALNRAEAGDLSPATTQRLESLPAGTNVDDAARAARFQEQGITPSRGGVTQDFKTQVSEERLINSTEDPAAARFQAFKAEESAQFETAIRDTVDSLGVPAEAGNKLKGALEGRVKLLRKEKSDLYKQAASAAPEIKELPIVTDTIRESIPDSAVIRRIERLAGAETKALKELLSEFGVTTPDSAEVFLRDGSKITPLNVGNFEDFRQAINQIERADKTNAVLNLTRPIKKALDSEAALIDSAIKSAGITDTSVLNTLQKARSVVRKLKATEFSPDQLRGKLTSFKKDGVTPKIENSQAATTLLKAPIEEIDRVMSSLSKSPGGDIAIANIQSKVLLDALEDSLKAPSRKFAGTRQIGGNNFAKALEKLGDDKLAVLFKNNPKGLKRVKALRQSGIDLSPSGLATQKGSAPRISDFISRIGRIPVLVAPIVKSIDFVLHAGRSERGLRTALNAKPRMRSGVQALKDEYPKIAAALGVSAASLEANKPLTIIIEKSAKDFK